MEDLRNIDGFINKTPSKLSIGVAGVCIYENKVLLVKNTKADYWSFPGGHIHENESLQEALKRELFEEVGQSSFKVLSAPIFYQYNLNNELTLLLFFYKIELQDSTTFSSVNDEVVDQKWFDIQNLPENIYENTRLIIKEFSISTN